MSYKIILCLCLISAVVSAAATRYYFPQIKSQTVTVEKEVIRDNVVTVVHTVTKPDGTTDSTITTTDKTEKTIRDSSSQTVAVIPPNWLVGGGVGFSNLSFAQPVYNFQANRRVLGPIFVGGGLTLKGDFDIHLLVEF